MNGSTVKFAVRKKCIKKQRFGARHQLHHRDGRADVELVPGTNHTIVDGVRVVPGTNRNIVRRNLSVIAGG